ncbi:hypothetical protein, partial [Streptomyces werraensis]|uniref:hypothetical protein n=1 Tax=Streptomyces werraensis TaxID=68284 RepID=UPI003421A05A
MAAARERTAMNWTDSNGARQKLYESGARRLEYVKKRGSVGRLQTPEGETWRASDVRKFQDTGLWEVDWVEPGDLKREGGWVIVRLTAQGRKVLEEWQRLVEEGGGRRGPQRQARAEKA